jgi:hypothetical protein
VLNIELHLLAEVYYGSPANTAADSGIGLGAIIQWCAPGTVTAQSSLPPSPGFSLGFRSFISPPLAARMSAEN